MTVSVEILYLIAGLAAGAMLGLCIGYLVFSGRSRKLAAESRHQLAEEASRPVLEALEKFERQVQAMENLRQNSYGGLSEQVASLARTQQDLQRETGRLIRALRQPQVRGRWGEITLRRVAEIAGMQNHCDFYEQPAVHTEDGVQRPDMVVRLPGERRIVIDAKVPLSAYLDALENGDDEMPGDQTDRHADQVRSHMLRLAQKSYWRQFVPTPEFVVLFMPGENFFSAALSSRPDLIEEGAARGVILATPTTLITLLKTVAYAWRQESAVENAREVSRLGSRLYHRIQGMIGHLNSLGRELDRCVSAYNKTVGALERRVLVSARRFQELGVVETGKQSMEPPPAIDNKPRQTDAAEADESENG